MQKGSRDDIETNDEPAEPNDKKIGYKICLASTPIYLNLSSILLYDHTSLLKYIIPSFITKVPPKNYKLKKTCFSNVRRLYLKKIRF